MFGLGVHARSLVVRVDGQHPVRACQRVPAVLEEHGLGRWTRIEALHGTAAVFQRVLGAERVGVSRDGFNA